MLNLEMLLIITYIYSVIGYLVFLATVLNIDKIKNKKKLVLYFILIGPIAVTTYYIVATIFKIASWFTEIDED